jgi:hypothetical protein
MTMLFEKIVSYQFKGERKYVPGVDLFDSMLDLVHHFLDMYPTSIQGSFHRILRNNAVFRILEAQEAVAIKHCYAHFSVSTSTAGYQVTVTQTDEAISSSYNYDEDQVTNPISWTNKAAEIQIKSGYSYMEQLVVITKKMHQRLYPEATGQWLFTKIQVKDFIDPNLYIGHRLMVKAVKNFHNKLTQNIITLDEKPVGDIWFSLLSKEAKK